MVILEPPKDYVPRPYGSLMTRHMVNVPRCAVWAPPGFGKTVTTLTALDQLSFVDDVFPALVLAPVRVARDVWPKEVRKWKHLKAMRVVPVIGTADDRKWALKREAEVYTINYENLEWLVDLMGDAWPFKTVVPDEATRLKGLRVSMQKSKTGKEFLTGQGGKRTKALAKVAHTKVKRFIELTGTPSPNGLQDLWGQMWFLDPKLLGHTYDSFKRRWFQKSFDGHGLDPLPFADQQIHDALRDVCMSLKVEDWFDIELPIEKTIYVDLPFKARAQYREMEKQMFTEIDGHEIEAFAAAARTQKCLQLANGAAYVGDPLAPGERKWVPVHTEKLEALESLLEEAGGMPLLVSYEFKSDLARILAWFKGKAVDIGTAKGMEQFRAGKALIGCGHPASVGHGVDGLQDVTNIGVFFGHNWNLETYLQFIERIGPVRQAQSGHKRPVYLYHIVARGTVDELVMSRRETKRDVQDILMEALKCRNDL